MLKELIFIISMQNTGDYSHAEAIYAAFSNKYPNEIIERIDFDAKSLEIGDNLRTYLSSKKKNTQIICFAIGESGLNVLNTLDDIRKYNAASAIKVVASIHQYFDVLENLQQKIDLLSIPESVLTEDALRVVKNMPSYNLTLGVPTKNPSLNDLEKAYNLWDKPNKPTVGEPLITVMLPGDAPTKDGTIKLFTKESALELFNNLYKLWTDKGRKHKIFLQNSPRTGKFDVNGQIICNHEYKKDEDPIKAIDNISKYFVTLLAEKNMPFEFFNFAFEISEDNKRIVHSVYNQSLFLTTSNQNNLYIVPAESVSMLSQIPLYFEPTQVVVFRPSSMNEQHEAILTAVLNRGHALCFGELEHTKENLVKMNLDDASSIVNAVTALYNDHDSVKRPKYKPY
jgi:hypothetical protein